VDKKCKEETFIDYNRYNGYFVNKISIIGKECIAFLSNNGRKKYFKISTITDSFGTPLTSTIISSKQSDNISLIETIEKMPINLNTLRNSKINRYKQHLLADSGYHSSANKETLEKIGYISWASLRRDKPLGVTSPELRSGEISPWGL
jgi:hypothetical protein